MNTGFAMKGAALLLAGVAIGAVAGSAQAGVTMYSTQAAFDTAAPGATTFGFNAGGAFHFGPNPRSSHGLTFTDNVTAADIATGGAPMLILVPAVATPTYGVDFLSYQNTQTGISGDILSSGTTAIGFSYGTYVDPGPATVTLSTGDSFAIAPTTTAAFIGFTSTTPITSVTIDFPDPHGFSFDLTSVSVLGGVPEPSAWAMMLLGLGGLGAVMRRRRSAAAAA